MDREETLSLLRELMKVFESVGTAPIVSITHDKKAGNWGLSVNWIAGNVEKNSLSMIAAKHSAKITEEKDYTIFH